MWLDSIENTTNIDAEFYWSCQQVMTNIHLVQIISSGQPPIDSYYAIDHLPELISEFNTAPLPLNKQDIGLIDAILSSQVLRIQHYAYSITAAARFETSILEFANKRCQIAIEGNLVTVDFGDDLLGLYLVKSFANGDLIGCCFLSNDANQLYRLFRIPLFS